MGPQNHDWRFTKCASNMSALAPLFLQSVFDDAIADGVDVISLSVGSDQS